MPKKNEMSKEELDKLKEQLKKELLVEMKKEEAEKYKEEQEKKRKEEEALKLAQEPTAFKIKTDNKIDKFDRNITNTKVESKVENISATSNIFLVLILLIVLGGIYFLPVIRDTFTKKKTSEPDKPVTPKPEPTEEKVEYKWSDQLIEGINLPIMRNDKNSPDSYYSLASMDITSFSNNDILYNALINVYSGNMAPYQGGYNGAFCGNDSQRRILNAKYITARVNNMFTKSTKFDFTDFYVPVSSGSPYYGLWVYDGSSHSYIYYGECYPQVISEPLYYDVLVEDTIETSEDGKTAYLTYDIGFAIISDNTYSIYRDTNYTDLLISDTFKTDNHEKELHDVLENFLENHRINKYKYTYSKINCSYSELCYISGEWVNE